MEFDASKLRYDLMKKRMKEGLSLRKAAEHSGVSFATLSRIENFTTPDIETLAKLCDYLNTKPNRYFINK